MRSGCTKTIKSRRCSGIPDRGCLQDHERAAGSRTRRRLPRQALWTLLLIVTTSLWGLTPPMFGLAFPQNRDSPTNPLKLDEILAGMDQSARSFTSMSGDLDYTKVTVIVNDRSTERGKIFFQKTGGKTRVMISFRDPAEKHVLFAEGKVSIYQPKIAEVTEYQIAQKQDLVEQFLLLGFGTSGKELRKAYEISGGGEENLDGQQVYVLELVPKSEKVAAQLQRIDLWISPQNWQPVQQKFYEPGGDYIESRYRNLKWNEKIPDKSFRLPLKGKVKVVKPQGL